MHMLHRACLLFCLLALPAAAEVVQVRAGYFEVDFDTAGGAVASWTVCDRDCREPGALRAQLIAPGDGFLRATVAGDEGATSWLRQLSYSADIARTADEVVLILRARSPSGDRAILQRWTFPLVGHLVGYEAELPAGAALEFSTGSVFVPEPLPGVGAIYGHVNAVLVSDGEQVKLDEDEVAEGWRVGASAWGGIRNRFWTLLLRADQVESALSARGGKRDRPVVTVAATPAEGDLALSIYAGPVEWERLRATDSGLSAMLFAAIWDWLRALCFGMLILLQWLQDFTGSYGLAIILLSLSMKILMWPLTHVADGWQEQVNRTHSLLQPKIDLIKRRFKGEEAHNKILAVYKEHGVHPMYTFKSLAGFLIQIPVFIAAFDMLGENFALNETAFLWTSDLAKPDRWQPLPFVLPFFGGYLNLLPFIMTGLSSLAALLQQEESLTPQLQKKQRLRLYLMAAGFFVLFYTFPAGMVLYWTSSNLFHLIKVEGLRLLRPPAD